MVKINIDDNVERMINESPMEEKGDTDLTTAWNNIFKKVIEKVWVKKRLKSSILH